MSNNYRKRKTEQDPVYVLLDGFFKGVGWLAMLPFKGLFSNRGPSHEQIAKVNREYLQHWLSLENNLHDPNQAKHAIMQADILLDKAMEFKGIPGATMGDRLKGATSQLSKSTLDMAWEAHRVRNRLAHELNYHISESEARQVLGQFKAVLRTLGVL